MLFYLKYLKYSAILFLIMSVLNIPVLLLYRKASDDSPLGNYTFLRSLTVAPLFDMASGEGVGGTRDKSFFWATLVLFIFHLMFQHLHIIIYQQECDAWISQEAEVAKDKQRIATSKHIRENSFAIYGLNQGDSPKDIKVSLHREISRILQDLKEKTKEKAEDTETCSGRSNPPFSIHIPGDLNSVSELLDQYEDAEKQAQFCL